MKLAELLNEVNPEYKKRVEDVKKRWRDKIRNQLKSILKLDFAEGIHFNIKVDEAYPDSIAEITLSESEYMKYLLFQNRAMLVDLDDKLEKLHGIIYQIENNDNVDSDFKSIIQTQDIISKLVKQAPEDDDFVKMLMEVDPHIFGTYRGGRNGGIINLYWAVIGLFAERWNVNVISLAIIILVHEYAHAITQHGIDANNVNWEQSKFNNADVWIIEGIAEYITYLFVKMYDNSIYDLMRTYRILFQNSPPEYQDYENWGSISPESIRYALLQSRRNNNVQLTYQMFKNFLKEGQNRFGTYRGPEYQEKLFY